MGFGVGVLVRVTVVGSTSIVVDVVVVVIAVVVVGFCSVSMMDCGFSDGDGKFERSWVVGRSRRNCVRRYLFAGDSW